MSLCQTNEGMPCSAGRAPLYTQLGYRRARPRSVILPRAIFDHGSAQLAWRGANLQVSQNRCWALASPPTHTRQFSRRDACGFMVGFIKDSGILRPLKSFCLSFVSVKTCGDWV